MEIDPSNPRDIEKLNNEALDMNILITTNQGVYIISESKGNIKLIKPVIIKMSFKDFMVTVSNTVKELCKEQVNVISGGKPN